MKNCLFFFWCCFSLFGLIQEASGSSRFRQRASTCPPISLKNGVAKMRHFRARLVRFTCNRGYSLAGQRYSNCLQNGTWDPTPPRCVRSTCKPFAHRENLLTYPTHSGAVLYFHCKSGYELNGPENIYCDGKIWSESVPRCIPFNTKPKLSCDFETTDLCGWTHDLNHDFDWSRENFNTPSGAIGTGPAYDHTKGFGKNGYYMYTESSLKAENDTARLISPVYEKMDSDVCFEFYYHMYGSTIGSLRVYKKTVKEAWNLYPQNAFFSASGNHGDKWYRSLNRLGPITDEFQIIIEGVRGPGYVSDIAIDDVKLIPNCTAEEETTTVESSTFYEQVPIIDTCDKRCGQVEDVSHERYHLTCDCDDDCFGNNRCCPDYFDICSGTTSDDFETTISTEETVTEAITTGKVLSPVSPLPQPSTELASRGYPTTKVSYKRTSTTQTVSKSKTTPSRRISVTPLKPTTQIKPTKKQMSNTTMTSKIIPKITRPILYFQTPSPTPVIYRKIVVTTLPPPTPFMFGHKTSKSAEKIDTTNDALDVPMPTNSDEGLIENLPKEFWPDEIENNIDTPYLRNFSESDKLFSQSYVETANSHFLVIGVSVMGVAILISVVLFIAIRRYRSRGMSSNGDSQSDVVYLKNNDVLDFSLADCYDE